jgi:hypothetical protein
MHELTGQAIAIVTLLIMILLSYAILRGVTDEERNWEALRGRALL